MSRKRSASSAYCHQGVWERSEPPYNPQTCSDGCQARLHRGCCPSKGDPGSNGSYLPCSPSAASSGGRGAPDQTGMKGSLGLCSSFSGRAGSACLQPAAAKDRLACHRSSRPGSGSQLCLPGMAGVTACAVAPGETGQKPLVLLGTPRGLQTKRSISPKTAADFASDLSLIVPRDRRDLRQLLSFSPSPQHFTPGAFTSWSAVSGILCPSAHTCLFPLRDAPDTAAPRPNPAFQSSAAWLQAAHNTILQQGDPCSLALCNPLSGRPTRRPPNTL